MTDAPQPIEAKPPTPAPGDGSAPPADHQPREKPREEESRAPRPRWLNPWLLAPLAVGVSIALIVRQQASVPKPGDWRAATETISAGLEPGDGVTWAPYWAGEGRIHLHSLPAFHLASLADADLARYTRVWIMGAFGRDADELPEAHRLLERREFGPLTLDLVDVGGERVLGDLRAGLESVRVRQVSRRRTKACDFWDGRGWHCKLRKSPAETRKCLARPIRRRLRDRRRDPHCGLDPWINVSRDVRVIGDHPRRCVWFHPLGGKTLQAYWPEAPVGESLVVDHGFTDKVITDHTREETRTRPATLRVRRGEDGPVLGEHIVTPDKGWRRWRLPLGGPSGGGLTIEVETEATTDAHLCIDVTVRGAAAGEGG